MLAAAEEKVAKVRKKYDRGYISEEDRYQQTIAIWRDATNEVKSALKENFGVTMSIDTTLPGVQFYSGNFMQGHAKRSGFCLEPQTFPDAVNQPAFGQDVILRPGETRRDAIRWRFTF